MDKTYSKLGYHSVSGEKINFSEEDYAKIVENLKRFDIPEKLEPLDFPSFEDSDEFPISLGFDSYNELVEKLAKFSVGIEINLVENFLKDISTKGIPLPPSTEKINISPGWSKYDYDGNFISNIDYPEDKILVFDTETYVMGNNLPIIATATGSKFSYIWLAREFCSYTDYSNWDQLNLVPLPNTKVVIAHNAMFDVCRIRESYSLPVSIKALDTLSMHVVTNGFCSQQRYFSLLKEKDPSDLTWKEKGILKNPPAWGDVGSTNSLVSVYNLHVANTNSFLGDEPELGKEDKELRDVFVKTPTMDNFVDLGEFRKDIISYASKDTYYTTKIFKHLYPKYKESKPHIAALSGHLLLSTARVPLTSNWDEWIFNCERLLEELNTEASNLLKSEAKKLYLDFISGKLSLEKISEDPFLSQLDWTIVRKKSKTTPEYISKLLELDPNTISSENLPTFLRSLFLENPKYVLKKGYEFIPKWYSGIYSKPDSVITPKTELSHLLLRIHYEGYPLYKHKSKGWGYFVNESFTKVKNHSTPNANVGNVLGKSYIEDMKLGILTGEHPLSKRIFEIAIQTSFWISTRSRVLERFYMKANTPDSEKLEFNMMCPQPIFHGTISGRQTENLFLVLCSPKSNKIASEAKSRVVAPPGYKIVGSDFSSQELVLASLYGDRELGGLLGSCPMSYRTLLGNKDTYSDIHSDTAYQLFLKDKGYRFIDGEWYIEE